MSIILRAVIVGLTTAAFLVTTGGMAMVPCGAVQTVSEQAAHASDCESRTAEPAELACLPDTALLKQAASPDFHTVSDATDFPAIFVAVAMRDRDGPVPVALPPPRSVATRDQSSLWLMSGRIRI